MPKKIASRSRADRPEWYARKIQDVADFFRLSYSHICKQRWFSEYAKTRKGYYLPDLAERRHGQVIRAPQALDEDGGKPESIHAKKLEEAHENVRRKRRENDEQEAELLRRNDVERALILWAVRFRSPLLSLSTKIASLVPGSQKATAERMVKDEVRNALIQVRDMRINGEPVEKLILREAAAIRKERAATKKRRPSKVGAGQPSTSGRKRCSKSCKP